MADYHFFPIDPNTPPDAVALLAAVRTATADPTAGMYLGTLPVPDAVGEPVPLYGVRVKKATAWTDPEITATQAAIEAVPAQTPQRQAQNEIDQWPIAMKAFALAVRDALNQVRAGLPTPLPPITVQQMLAAIRTKAGEL